MFRVPLVHWLEEVACDPRYVPPEQVPTFPEDTSGPMGGHALPDGHHEGVEL